MEEKIVSLLSEVLAGKATFATFAGLVLIGPPLIWRALRIYSAGGPLQMLTFHEHRIKARLMAVKAELAETEDPVVRAALVEVKNRLQLQLVYGLDVSPTVQRELLGIQECAGGRTSWKYVRVAVPHLRFEGSRVVPGLSWPALVFGWLFTLLGLSAYVLCVALFFIVTDVDATAFFPALVVAAIVMAPLALMGEACLRAALPMMAARRLQRAVKQWRAAQGDLLDSPPSHPRSATETGFS